VNLKLPTVTATNDTVTDNLSVFTFSRALSSVTVVVENCFLLFTQIKYRRGASMC